ncbi:hypothetical protein [Nocardioides pacificus]
MATRFESWDGEQYEVRAVSGSASTRPYRCPGCHQGIPPATPHTVAWPVVASLLTSFDGTGVDERRHWHNHCWRSRRRR